MITISPEGAFDTTRLARIFDDSSDQADVAISWLGRRMTRMAPEDPHFMKRCWKKGKRLIAIWATPSVTRKLRVPLAGLPSDTGSLDKRSSSLRRFPPNENASMTFHHSVVDVNSSLVQDWYMWASSKRFGVENEMQDLEESIR